MPCSPVCFQATPHSLIKITGCKSLREVGVIRRFACTILRDVQQSKHPTRWHPMSSAKPAISKDILLFVSRISAVEKAALFTSAFQRDDLDKVFKSAIHEVAIQRLVRAEACHNVALILFRLPEEESLRSAIGRAYYSIHHSIRAMILYELQFDPDGHQASIDALAELLRDNGFRGRSGLQVADAKEISSARDNREIADYSPFDVSRRLAGGNDMRLSHPTWTESAKFNVDLSLRILVASMKVVGVA